MSGNSPLDVTTTLFIQSLLRALPAKKLTRKRAKELEESGDLSTVLSVLPNRELTKRVIGLVERDGLSQKRISLGELVYFDLPKCSPRGLAKSGRPIQFSVSAQRRFSDVEILYDLLERTGYYCDLAKDCSDDDIVRGMKQKGSTVSPTDRELEAYIRHLMDCPSPSGKESLLLVDGQHNVFYVSDSQSDNGLTSFVVFFKEDEWHVSLCLKGTSKKPAGSRIFAVPNY